MSVKVMSLVWGWKLATADKLVLLKLADCADDRGRNSFPAVATIADSCGLTRRGAQKVLERLRQRGYIDVQAAATNRRSTIYQLALEEPLEANDVRPSDALMPDAGGEPGSPLGANDVRPNDDAGGEQGSPLEANGETPRGERGSPLGANVVRPIRPGSVSDPSCTQRARAKDGRREHPLDEEPQRLEAWSLEAFEQLWAIYPRQEARVPAMRAWQALNPARELAEFILRHVETRVKLGWASHVKARYIPLLRTFLDERRWMERWAPPSNATTAESADGLPEGMTVMRSCPKCKATQEGRVQNGQKVFAACPCTSQSGAA